MADSNIPQYPMMFDPSQFSNKYSTMNNQSFPMYNYYGTPTDAMGNPIASYQGPSAQPQPAQGTTLNSVPASAGSRMSYQDWAKAMYDPTIGRVPISAISDRSMSEGGFAPVIGQVGQGQGIIGATPYHSQTIVQQAAPQQQQQIPSSGFNYLLALANPNKVKTPGVYDYPAPTYQPDSSGIDAMLKTMQSNPQGSWPAPRPGIGGGSQDLSIIPNSNFLNTLAALRASSPSSGAK